MFRISRKNIKTAILIVNYDDAESQTVMESLKAEGINFEIRINGSKCERFGVDLKLTNWPNRHSVDFSTTLASPILIVEHRGSLAVSVLGGRLAIMQALHINIPLKSPVLAEYNS